MSKKNNSNNGVILFVGLVLVIIGLWLTSYSHQPGNWQSDGYNVTGGIICIIGGFFIGLWFSKK